MLISKLSENDLCKMRTSKIGFIYQFHHLIKELSVRENISLPLLIKNNDNSDIRMAADNIIDQVGLKHRADYQIDKLSGGERQRVAIARSVVHNPKIIFADEPTGNLDKNNAKNILSLLSDLVNFNNSSLIMATHDLEMAALLNKRMSIENGSINTI
jgi:lipoprotein-releasing system ATP-binding protein